MADWWERVDRLPVLAEARGLVPDGGCLVIQGTDDSGRLEILNLLEDFFRSTLGHNPLRIASVNRSSSLRSLLLKLWAALDEAPTAGLAPWTTASNLHVTAIRTEVEGLLINADRPVLLLEDVDRDEPLPIGVAKAWSDLAARAGCPVVLTSLPHTDWGAAAGIRYAPLPGFSESDVRECLVSSPELAERPVAELDEALALIREPDGEIASPSQVYTRLAAWSFGQ